MKKNTIIGGAIILVIIAGIVFFLATKPASVKTPATGIVLPATGFSEHAKYYDITADYATSTPLLKSVGELADANARSLMYGFIRDTVLTFKSEGNFDNLTSEDIKMMGFADGRKESLQITYKVTLSPRTVSYIYTIYEDTLGAHGNTFFHTFTFDTKTGVALSLADIFLPNVSYLNTLSSTSRAKLPAVIGEGFDTSMIKGGTTQDVKNFENFYFDGKEFVILFPPYQVASYASGPQTLRIPTSQISSILKPEYQ